MRDSFKSRLDALEQHNLEAADVQLAIVQIIAESGRTSAQTLAAAVALRDGVRIVAITYRDARRPPT